MIEHTRNRRPGKIVGGALAAAVVALPLAACQSVASGPPPAPLDQRHAYHASSETVALDIPADPRGLSDGERHAVSQFVTAYSHEGEGPLELVAPSGPDSEMVLGEVRQVSRAHGVPASALSYTDYPAKGASKVTLRYQRYAATEKCGRWPTNLGSGWRNVPYENFGCATRRNLAAMVEDPRDLYGPRRMTPRDAERRDAIYDNYRRGTTTDAQTGTDGASGLGD